MTRKQMSTATVVFAIVDDGLSYFLLDYAYPENEPTQRLRGLHKDDESTEWVLD